MEVLFITSNEDKFREAEQIGLRYGVTVRWAKIEYLEPQGSDLEEIAKQSAKSLSYQIKKPFFIEDSGLFVEALKGFPGPYSSYVFKTIGNEGIVKLMDGLKERKAYFLAVIAFFDGEKVRIFTGRVNGEIAKEIRGDGGFGFDPVFLYGKKTFAEMGDEKNKVSHRRKALENFFAWLGKSF
jgi:XTP/dITP diphosphohydrolase